MREYREVESKYKADGLTESEFNSAVQNSFLLNLPIGFTITTPKFIVAESSDYYFTKNYEKDKTFLRYRADKEKTEFTVKKKLNDENNLVRLETNLQIKPSTSDLMDFQTAKNFCNCLGFKYEFAVYKICYIYIFNGYTIVFYSVYDNNKNYLDSYVEIEVEDNGELDEYLLDKLTEIETQLNKTLPNIVNYKKRIKNSLYEIYAESF